ncbi:arylsulfotransferase family protein [Virgibacillus doumboii]|uniref:arylsulfotransferase family protein n=1 Tax=Virgibacillus doumboii TaxID=2697503 RepID=UPI0013DF5DBE|nr:aryl-sulfate sulfotransferase [Virgibacillus doumboii]
MKVNKRIIAVIGIILYTLLVAAVTYYVTDSGSQQAQSVTTDKTNNQQDTNNSGENSFPKDYNWIPLPEIDLENSEKEYEIKSLTTEASNVIDLRTLSDHNVQINGHDVTGKDKYELELNSISEDNYITLTVDGTDYQIKTLPDFLSDYEYENNGASDGFYYFSYGDYIVKLSTNGQIVYYKNVGTAFSFDFKLNKTDEGEIYYSYLVRNNGHEKVPGIGYHPTKAVVMDADYNVVDEVESIKSTNLVSTNPLESHEFVFIELGHYIISSYYPEEVNNIPSDIKQNQFGTRVIATYLQEIKDNEVVWEWKSTEHQKLYGLSTEHNDFTNTHSRYADYMHYNSLAIDPDDGNLIVSFRNLSSIVKLNRETGEIMWTLGGKGDQFGLTEEQLFSRQHKLSFLSDGTILFFNNGNILPAAPYPIVDEDDPLRDKEAETSIVKIKLDEENKEVENYEEYETGEFSKTRGSVQMINEAKDTILIGWGSGDNNEAHFTELNFSTGEALFTFYPHDEDLISYRAYKFKQ